MEPAQVDAMPLFADLDSAVRAEVAACMQELAVDPGTVLAEEGKAAYQFFVIEAGEAEVRKDGELIRTMREGDFFGEIGVLVTGKRTASVTATTPMRLAVMFARDFTQLERRTPEVAEQVRETLRERVARTSF